jgi:hypothetical protein
MSRSIDTEGWGISKSRRLSRTISSLGRVTSTRIGRSSGPGCSSVANFTAYAAHDPVGGAMAQFACRPRASARRGRRLVASRAHAVAAAPDRIGGRVSLFHRPVPRRPLDRRTGARFCGHGRAAARPAGRGSAPVEIGERVPARAPAPMSASHRDCRGGRSNPRRVPDGDRGRSADRPRPGPGQGRRLRRGPQAHLCDVHRVGSSVGALVVPAALADTAEIGAPAPPPCTTEGAGSWFGKFAKAVAEPGVRFDPTRSWRDCFQLILAGDFLSPVMVGLAYRDTFPLGNPFSGTPLPTPAPGCRCFSSTERLYAIGVYELKPPQSAVSDQRKTMPLRENPLCRQVVRKRAAMGHVSMSWWMSQSVQAYLDAQLCVKAIGSGWNASCGKAARQQAETASPSRRCWKRKRADDAARKCLTCRARAWAGAAGSIALIAHTRSTPVNNSHSVSADSDAARGPFPIVVCYGSLIVSCIAAASRLTSQWNVGRLAMQGTGAIEMAAVRVLVRTLLGTRA